MPPRRRWRHSNRNFCVSLLNDKHLIKLIDLFPGDVAHLSNRPSFLPKKQKQIERALSREREERERKNAILANKLFGQWWINAAHINWQILNIVQSHLDLQYICVSFSVHRVCKAFLQLVKNEWKYKMCQKLRVRSWSAYFSLKTKNG